MLTKKCLILILYRANARDRDVAKRNRGARRMCTNAATTSELVHEAVGMANIGEKEYFGERGTTGVDLSS